MIYVNASARNIIYEKKIMNLATCSCENGKYLERIIDDSLITCDELPVPRNFNENNMNCKTQNLLHY